MKPGLSPSRPCCSLRFAGLLSLRPWPRCRASLGGALANLHAAPHTRPRVDLLVKNPSQALWIIVTTSLVPGHSIRSSGSTDVMFHRPASRRRRR